MPLIFLAWMAKIAFCILAFSDYLSRLVSGSLCNMYLFALAKTSIQLNHSRVHYFMLMQLLILLDMAITNVCNIDYYILCF